MGQGLSCGDPGREHALFSAIQNGELEIIEAMVDQDPSVLGRTTVHGKLFALHVAASHGQIEVLSMLLIRSINPDILNRHKQTPLMLAAMSGNISCVERLIQAGANFYADPHSVGGITATVPDDYFAPLDMEFVAPTEYMVVTQTIKSCLDKLSGSPRTQIGFITYDSRIHFYNMKFCLVPVIFDTTSNDGGVRSA